MNKPPPSGAARTVRLMADGPRPFSTAEKSLIRKVHGYMPAAQLLELLNERLAADFGPDEDQHTMEQLRAEVGHIDSAPDGDHDWTSIRKLLAKAKRDGILGKITRQVIDDFAVVYSLNSAQVLRLQDVLLSEEE